MELVIGPARQLNHFLSSIHFLVAESALANLLLHIEDNGGTETTLDALGHGLVGVCNIRVVLAHRLLPDEGETTVIFPLVAADGMVFEVVEATQLIVDELEGEDRILELVSVLNLGSLIAAASQNRVDEEDGDAGNDENRVLEHVDNEVEVEAGSADVVDATDFKKRFPLVGLPLDEVDGVADDSSLDDPLDDGPWSEALVPARLPQEAVAEAEVEGVEDALSKRNALHLHVEADVEQEVRVEQVEQDQHQRHDREDNALGVFVLKFFLFGNGVDEPHGAAEDQPCP